MNDFSYKEDELKVIVFHLIPPYYPFNVINRIQSGNKKIDHFHTSTIVI